MKAKLFLSFGLLGLLMTGCGNSGGTGNSASTGAVVEVSAPAASPDCSTQLASFFTELLDLTNGARQTNGLSGLRFSSQLGASAQGHAQDMAVNDYFSHTSLNGDTLADRIGAVDYSFQVAGENIAAGFFSPQTVFDAWMDSPGHRANILNADYQEVGFGLFFNSNSTYDSYWVQNFGTPALGRSDAALFLPTTCSVGTVASTGTRAVRGIRVAAVRPPGRSNRDRQPLSVPEPAVMLGIASCVLGGYRLRRRQKAAKADVGNG
jgi:uncharacterized protein YkwD